jgi:dimethylsulfoniopropionate demethylase
MIPSFSAYRLIATGCLFLTQTSYCGQKDSQWAVASTSKCCDPDVFPLSLQGPKSETLLSRLIAEPVEDIRFFRFIHSRIDDIDLVVARTGWSGQGGFELYLSEPAEGERLWDIIVAAGADLNLRSGCPNLIDRIETGLLSHGNDVTLANNPIESGLNRFFKMGKDADYLGKQALEKIVAEGHVTALRATGIPWRSHRKSP